MVLAELLGFFATHDALAALTANHPELEPLSGQGLSYLGAVALPLVHEFVTEPWQTAPVLSTQYVPALDRAFASGLNVACIRFQLHRPPIEVREAFQLHD